jgi:prepilin-type processing-associated H-X9-DG protein
MSTGGEVTLGRGKGGVNVSWADGILTRPKNEENS